MQWKLKRVLFSPFNFAVTPPDPATRPCCHYTCSVWNGTRHLFSIQTTLLCLIYKTIRNDVALPPLAPSPSCKFSTPRKSVLRTPISVPKYFTNISNCALTETSVVRQVAVQRHVPHELCPELYFIMFPKRRTFYELTISRKNSMNAPQ